MNETGRRDEWIRYLKGLSCGVTKANTLVHIQKTEPKMISDVLKGMQCKSAEDVVKWIAS